MNPSLDTTTAQGAIDSQIEQAYYKTKIATAAQSAADLPNLASLFERTPLS
jgi:hypothetical protein